MTRPVTSVTSKDEQVFDRTHLAGFIKNMSQYIEDAKAELKNKVNPQAPAAEKSADEVVFQFFEGEGVEFFSNRP